METLKSIVAWGLSPLVIGLGLQLSGFLFQFLRKARAARAFLVAGTLTLLLGSLPVLGYSSNRDREYLHPAFEPARLADPDGAAVVVVLGTGFNPDQQLPPNSRLGATLTARLLEGVRVHRMLPRSRMLVSLAGEAGNSGAKRRTLDELAEIFDLDSARIGLLAEAKSTLDEALMTRDERHNDESVIIATSAGHMPRAMEIFGSQGLDPVAAPADYRHPRPGSPAARPWQRWIPSLDGLRETRDWLYETGARAAARLKV